MSLLEIDALLAPIPGDQPAGRWLRAADDGRTLWNAIKDARQTARDAEAAMNRPPDPDAPKESKPEDLPNKIKRCWTTVLTQGDKALREYTKDLTVASWMTEALLRFDGLPGLRDGLTLCRQLCEKFWPGLYPPLDDLDVEEGIHTTVTQLAGLSAALEAPMNQLVLTDSGKKLLDWLRAKHIEGLDPEARQKALGEGAFTLEMLAAEGLKMSPEVHAERTTAINEAIDEVEKLKAFLTENCYAEKPSGEKIYLIPNLVPLSDLLERVRDAVKTVRGAGDFGATAEAGGAPAAGGGGGVAGGGPLGQVDVRSREAAYAQVLQIADYLERAEPHSPVPHVLRQAVRFGRMSLPDLLVELLGQGDALRNISLRTGIKIPE